MCFFSSAAALLLLPAFLACRTIYEFMSIYLEVKRKRVRMHVMVQACGLQALWRQSGSTHNWRSCSAQPVPHSA